MSIGSRMKERRESLGMTQVQLAELLGVSKGAIGNFETDRNSPKASNMYKVFEVLQCDANYIYQDEMRELNTDDITVPEVRMIKKYRDLDDHGKEMVTLTLDCEARRMKKVKEEKAAAAPKKPAMKVIPLLGTSFAAGTTEQESDIPWEDLEVDAASQAEFAIHINGNSMEPWLPDGSIAYGVKRRPTDGEVAALLLDGDFICKQVCQDVYGNLYLFALNRDRKDADQQIMHDTDRSLTCFGTIIMDRVPLPSD